MTPSLETLISTFLKVKNVWSEQQLSLIKNWKLRLFEVIQKAEHDYKFQQRITLTLENFEKLMKKSPKIRSTANNSNDTVKTAEAMPAKKQKVKQKDDKQEIFE